MRRFSGLLKRAMQLPDSIKSVIENNNVVVFSMASCPYCVKAKKALTEANVEFIEVIAEDEQLDDLDKVTSQSSVPSVWVKGTFIGGIFFVLTYLLFNICLKDATMVPKQEWDYFQ